MKTLIKKILKKYLHKQKSILNLNLLPQTKQKKVLISYLTKQFDIDYETATIGHPNINEVNIIIAFFIKNNFVIDVAYCNDNYFIEQNSTRQYDVIFGFGEVFRYFSKKSTKSLKVIYCTENSPKIAFQKELERVGNYNKRNKTNIKTERAFSYYLDEDFKNSDYAIILQNEYNAVNFENLISREKTFLLKTTGLKNDNYIFDRFIPDTKNNFIWIGSRGIIHKGLDLLVEAFTVTSSLNLHILGLNSKERSLLPRCLAKNIHIHGFIDVKSDEFVKIMNSSSFCVLPSCSEAMATSILTGMRHGLVPLITRETGVDLLPNNGYYFDSLEVNDMISKILAISKLDDKDLHKKHVNIFNFANSQYNLNSFNENFNKIMLNIIRK